MAATASTPILTYLAAIMAGTSCNQSVSVTATFNMTAGWEIQIPVRAVFLSVSADPIVNFYRSYDAGVNFDTVAMASFSIARVTGGAAQASITLPGGVYAIQMQNSGPSAATFFVNTAIILTAIQNL